MVVLRSVVFSTLVLGAACEQFKIPEVDAIVNNALKEHSSYVHYTGNASESSSGVSKRASSYWYENIAHQGISAFGPSGYTVYRNVKDYGAKGDFALFYVRELWMC
jgi:glucan 1,3-beta-glucosidase